MVRLKLGLLLKIFLACFVIWFIITFFIQSDSPEHSHRQENKNHDGIIRKLKVDKNTAARELPRFVRIH
jgi:hypothetical protein